MEAGRLGRVSFRKGDLRAYIGRAQARKRHALTLIQQRAVGTAMLKTARGGGTTLDFVIKDRLNGLEMHNLESDLVKFVESEGYKANLYSAADTTRRLLIDLAE